MNAAKRKVDYHPSVTIIAASETPEFLLSVYDETYSQVPFRGAANLIGGNPLKTDASPWETWVREIAEELNPDLPESQLQFDKRLLAPAEEIALLRDAILSHKEKEVAFADFYIHGLHYRENKQEGGLIEAGTYRAVFSVYAVTLPQTLFERARSQINQKKRILSEGIAVMRSLDEICAGNEFSTAHGTPFILGAYAKVPIAYPSGVWARKLEKPRHSYDAYAPDFEHMPTYRKF